VIVRCFDDLKLLSINESRPEKTLTVLAGSNDPFTADQPARRQRAEWFGALWDKHAFGNGVHLRRLHYTILSREERLCNGDVYENTDFCWEELCASARDARYLRLVDPSCFIDRRTSLPTIHTIEGEAASFDVFGAVEKGLNLPNELPGLPWISVSAPTIRQDYLVEIWVEKSTMNDILEPLAERYQCNLVEGAGEQSVTRCDELVERILDDGRPARIIYISDFDPAGLSMPVAVARKVEHRVRYDVLDHDIQVRPIALTLEQCNQYDLPETPLKEGEKRANKFREKWGRDATELDALEALRPGLMRQMVVEELDRYFDHSLVRRVSYEADRLTLKADQISADAHAEHADEMEKLNKQYRSAKSEFERTLVRIKSSRQSDCQKRHGESYHRG
jgi:hypothetical protein